MEITFKQITNSYNFILIIPYIFKYSLFTFNLNNRHEYIILIFVPVTFDQIYKIILIFESIISALYLHFEMNKSVVKKRKWIKQFESLNIYTILPVLNPVNN